MSLDPARPCLHFGNRTEPRRLPLFPTEKASVIIEQLTRDRAELKESKVCSPRLVTGSANTCRGVPVSKEPGPTNRALRTLPRPPPPRDLRPRPAASAVGSPPDR